MKKIASIIFIVTAFLGCKEVYNAPVQSPVTGYLVVEGFINSNSQGITSIQLTRTNKLVDTSNMVYEQNAQVTIESNANDSYPLHETPKGIYNSTALTLVNTEKYRLHIKTSDGKEYLSDYTSVQSTPAIDSVSWQRENGGVQLYINAHDESNNTKYYQWRFEETWEYHSNYYTTLTYQTNPQTHKITGAIFRDPNTQDPDLTLYKCWHTANSTNIQIGTTDKLSHNLIYQPLNYIPPSDWRLGVLYSMNVRQYALSKEAFQFLEKMKKNTEQLGSIFDAQPSELKGNIHSTTNPNETVIGFVEVSQEQTQRIFINRNQVPDWNYRYACGDEIIIANNPDSIARQSGLIPTVADKTDLTGNIIYTFYAAEAICVDCTLRGTNEKPSFWP